MGKPKRAAIGTWIPVLVSAVLRPAAARSGLLGQLAERERDPRHQDERQRHRDQR
jgi:hypothetical protein